MLTPGVTMAWNGPATTFRAPFYLAHNLPKPGAGADWTTSPAFVPYVQNVMNNVSPAQIGQFRLVYPQMFPGGNPVPVFSYVCPNPTAPPPTIACPSAGSYN